jgi:transposase-like protein
MKCPHCESESISKSGKYQLKTGAAVQHYLCKECHKRLSCTLKIVLDREEDGKFLPAS